MGNQHRIRSALWVSAATTLLASAVSLAQNVADRDAKEIGAYVLTEGVLAKYTQAVKNLGPLSKQLAGNCAEDDDDSDAKSLDETATRVNAIPGIRQAITAAGLTTREYLVFTFSLFQNGMAAWALDQPGGKLPPNTSMANVKFYRAHEADIKKLGVAAKSDCDGGEGEDSDEGDSPS